MQTCLIETGVTTGGLRISRTIYRVFRIIDEHNEVEILYTLRRSRRARTNSERENGGLSGADARWFQELRLVRKRLVSVAESYPAALRVNHMQD